MLNHSCSAALQDTNMRPRLKSRLRSRRPPKGPERTTSELAARSVNALLATLQPETDSVRFQTTVTGRNTYNK